jgi:hypothetical protein
MNKPNFIGIGTERAGTSWVFSMLAYHPDIWVPPLKELHFFDTIDPNVPSHNPRYKWHVTSRIKQKIAPLLKQLNRPEFYKNSFLEYLLWDYYYFSKKMNFEWYQKLFSEKFVKGRICGEYTPAYCNIDEQYIQQILTGNPETKFIMVVRNPYDQLRSSLIQNFEMIEKRSFDTVEESEMIEWLDSSFASKKTNIRDVLSKWQDNVEKDQLFIGFYDDIKNNPLKLIQDLYQFLEVDLTFSVEEKFYKRKINNLTKPNHIISENIENIIIEKTKTEVIFLKEIQNNIRIQNDK